MTPEEFAAAYPVMLAWIQQTIADHRHSAKSIASRQFKRLPLYFSSELMATTKVVTAARVQIPPLSSMGLQRFEEFERGDYAGVTYLDTIFVKGRRSNDEEIYCHELIHIIQWRLLGPERFLALISAAV